MKRSSSLRSLGLFLILAACGLPTLGDTLWCPHAGGIEGREDQQARAEKFISGQATSTSGLQIYLTADSQGLYLHSNLQLPGADGKISINSTDQESLPFWTAYLLDHDQTSANERLNDDAFNEAYRHDVTFFVDQKLFNDPKFGNLDFKAAEQVKVIGPDDQPRPSEVLEKDDGDDERIVQLDPNNPNVFGSVKQPEIIASYLQTSALPFRRDNVKVISLVNDQTFNDHLAKTVPNEYVRYDQASVQSLNDTFSRLHGKTVFVIGHIPVDSSDIDTGHFRVGIQDLEDTAGRNNVDLIVLGCDSKRYAQATGVLNHTIETLEILPQLANALDAQTNGEFWSRIASSEMKLVVTQSIVDNQGKRRVTIDVYHADQFGRTALVAVLAAAISAPVTGAPVAPGQATGGQASDGGQSTDDGWKRYILPVVCVFVLVTVVRRVMRG